MVEPLYMYNGGGCVCMYVYIALLYGVHAFGTRSLLCCVSQDIELVILIEAHLGLMVVAVV